MSKSIATNRNAFRNYHIGDKYECGISLLGNEVKQEQDSIEGFSTKISAGKRAQVKKAVVRLAEGNSIQLFPESEEA